MNQELKEYTIHKMKKHPVDELFTKRLADQTIQPSDQARERFRQLIQSNPVDEFFTESLEQYELKPSMKAHLKFEKMLDARVERRNSSYKTWYFGAAASVAIIVGLGVFLNQNSSQNDVLADKNYNLPISPKSITEKQSLNSVSRIQNKVGTTKTEVIVFSEAAKPSIETIQSKDVIEVFNQESTVAQLETVVTRTEDAAQPSDDSREVVNKFGEIKSLSPILTHQTESNFENPSIGDFVEYNNNTVTFERLRNFDDEPIGLLELASNDEYFFLHKEDDKEAKKLNVFQRIAIQFNHIKHGGRINARELGIRPRDIMAMADKFVNDELHLKDIKSSSRASFGH